MNTLENVPAKVRLTKKFIDALPIPTTGRYEIQDEAMDGLLLRVSSTGVKSFTTVRHCRAAGRTIRITHGKYPSLTIENARKLGKEINEQIAAGKNPQQAKQAIKDDLTFEELFSQFMTRWVAVKRGSAKEYQGVYDRHIKAAIGKRKLHQIDRKMIATLHSRIGQEHTRTANKVLAILSATYNKGISWELTKDNPAKGIDRFPERSKERFISKEELPRFIAALSTLESIAARDFFIMCLYTGARRANVLSMAWKNVDLENGVWHIPHTKNGTPQNVSLSNQAIALLKSKQQSNDTGNVWVFPSKTSKSGHLVEPKKSWHKLLEVAGIEDLTIHDLRRTFGSYLAMNNVSLHTIGKSLNHKSHVSTQVYAQMDLSPMKMSANIVGGIVEEVMKTATKKEE